MGRSSATRTGSSPQGLGNENAVDALKAGAQERAEGLSGIIASIRAEGITSANGIANALNTRHIATPVVVSGPHVAS